MRKTLSVPAASAGKPVTGDTLAKCLGHEEAGHTIAGMMGAFGRRLKHRHQGNWPFHAKYNAVAGKWEYTMPAEVAELLAKIKGWRRHPGRATHRRAICLSRRTAIRGEGVVGREGPVVRDDHLVRPAIRSPRHFQARAAALAVRSAVGHTGPARGAAWRWGQASSLTPPRYRRLRREPRPPPAASPHRCSRRQGELRRESAQHRPSGGRHTGARK
jgi:hypothetical protein